jgi:molybdopterin converting factor small subunit
MMVSVQFHGTHRLVTRRERMDVPLAENGRVKDLIAHLSRCFPGLRLAAEDLMITVNDQASTLSRMLKPNDTVAILPHIGGG